MNIKKILIYVIFAFVMIMPFSVSALSYKNIADVSDGILTTLINVIENNTSDDYIIVQNELDPGYYYAISGQSLNFLSTYSNTNFTNTLYALKDTMQWYKISKTDFSVSFSDSVGILNNSYYDYFTLYDNLFLPYSYKINGVQYVLEKDSEGNYLNFESSFLKNNIVLTDKSTYPLDFTVEFLIIYSKGSIGIHSSDQFFKDNGYSSLYFPSQTYDNVFSSKEQITVLSYNGKSNSSIELIYQISDEAYNDSCFSVLGMSWACDTYVTDYLDLNIKFNDSIIPYVYVSNDNKNWTYVSNYPSGSVLTNGFSYYYEYLSRFTGNRVSYVKYVINLKTEQIALITSKYDKNYIKMSYTPILYASDYYTEYDLTGKYAIGLVPKNSQGFLNGTFKYLGNFTTYAGSDAVEGVYNYSVLSSSDLESYAISYGSILFTQSPIFYIINNNYDNDTVSTIHYLSSLYYLVEFEDMFTSVIELNTDVTYHSPSLNVNVNSNFDKEDVSINTGLNFSDLFKKLPDFIVGLGSAFTGLGTCIMIAFGSLPEMVQAVLWFCLLVSAIVLVIKLLK